MHPTSCLMCPAGTPATQIFPQSADVEHLAGGDFAARKTHARRHYRIVKCDRCGLVRSSPILDETTIGHLYEESAFTYGDVSALLNKTYLRYGRRAFDTLPKDAAILDIGCGNGFLLKALYNQGFHNVHGFEPSTDAIRQAPREIHPRIIPKMFTHGDAAEHVGQFDLIGFFHVLDHIIQPDQFLKDCLIMLKPGGFIYGVTHNLGSPVHKIFGERSVAYDVQHIYLYSQVTIRKLLEQLGYTDITTTPIANTFPLGYLAHMAPLPAFAKRLLQANPWGRWNLTLGVGNMAFIAQKSPITVIPSPVEGSHA